MELVIHVDSHYTDNYVCTIYTPPDDLVLYLTYAMYNLPLGSSI